MDSKPVIDQEGLSPEDFSPDPKKLDRVREILLTLANAVSAMKIFPFEHATVKNFVDDLTRKLKAFLSDFEKIEIGIEEHDFTYIGKPVFRDDLNIKSLPFFFFKDGMQKLFFYDGLDADELTDFLELIKQESRKPPEEADIVNALWERDLANVQYYAPDDYLESRILEERNQRLNPNTTFLPAEMDALVPDIKVDPSRLSTGKIELEPDDREEAGEMTLEMAEKGVAADGSPEMIKGGAAAHDAALNDGEIDEINTLIHKNRAISPEEEFLNLMIEIIFLDKDLSQFEANLDVLMEYHLEQLQKGNFPVSILVIHKVRELKDHLVGTDPAKGSRLDAFLKQVIGEKTLIAAKDLFLKDKQVDINAFVDYLKLLGNQALPLSGDLYEALPDPEVRSRLLEYYRETASRDMGAIIGLATDSRPTLSRELIRLAATFSSPKTAQHLAVFLNSRERGIKLEAIHALGRIGDDIANKILAGFLRDPDEDLRIEAGLRIKYLGDTTRLLQIIQEASSRAFARKSMAEKQVIFRFLGRTMTGEALNFLRNTLNRSPLFPSAHRTELRLCAVLGLESMATEEALEALRRGTTLRGNAVRQASVQALIRLATPGARPNEEQPNG
jgi:HEAT repeat protein